ncbi:MBL fold metallo-hydrolase [Candidatus Woesearchaeota archaeon]|nr:MBL fold metallo-hydrolase [Candidatus Woesearchaeota archaeon]
MVEVKRLGHASFRIDGSKTIYIDPWKLSNPVKADIILISHSHFDHFSKEDVNKIKKDDTVIIAARDAAKEFEVAKELVPGQKIEIGKIVVEAVPAYNIGKEFHKKESGWLGFIINIDGKRIYYAGDTDCTPEMEKIKSIDIALMPVSGTYLMTAEEAAKAVKKINPKKAIPYHYGDVVGTLDDAVRFKELCSCDVEIQ